MRFNFLNRLLEGFLGAMLFGLAFADLAEANSTEKPSFTVGHSIYVGWQPWPYAAETGILQKWADRYGIEIKFIPNMDYIPSVEAYVAGKLDAVVMTNMECLDMPAAAQVDSTVSIVGDFSNGNDALLTVGIDSFKELAGQDVLIVELSVSHFGLARWLGQNGMKESDVRLVNTSDADIANAFLTSNAPKKAVVTWNPMVMQILQTRGVKKLADSSTIPGEILDLMVMRTSLLQRNPDHPDVEVPGERLAKALTGCWYEVLGIMSGRGPEANAAIDHMARLSNCTAEEFRGQLRTTAMFWTPEGAANYAKSSEIQKSMDFVRRFCFDHGLLGENVRSVDVVGIQYPDGTIQGDRNNVRMRFNSSFMELARDGKLQAK